MGWLKLSGRTSIETRSLPSIEDIKPTAQHVESISTPPQSTTYSFHPKSTPDSELPFIPSTVVSKHSSRASGGLWIVVDNIVYDCSSFIDHHPGGEEVIRSFGGQECSWQFWRFHGKSEMERLGRGLRIGRTEGLKNRFSEPVRWVGLRRRGLDEW
jgi:cytochrome b involved in lipid metabolism